MARPVLLGLLPLLALLPLPPPSRPQPGTAEGTAALAGRVLSALEGAASFLQERLPEVNLDGVVGFQVLEVQLRGVQEAWAAKPLLQPLSLRAGQLANKLTTLLRSSIPYLQLRDPEYLRAFQPSIQPGFWKLPRAWTRTNASLVYAVLEAQDSFSEDSSDACLAQLLGTRPAHAQPCALSDFCADLMTKPSCSGYSLSHQLLFFLWARMRGCTRGLFSHTQHYIDVFCANMMDQNRRAEALGHAFATQDLFMENIMFCGLSGFADFYKLRWLEVILSWQKPQEGCFGAPAPGIQAGPPAPEHQQPLLRRVRRREKQFTDGCSCHSTSTAVAALGGFLYILAEQPRVGGKPPPSTGKPLLQQPIRAHHPHRAAPEAWGFTPATPPAFLP
ncbi:UPF0764 protein C16orf89 homolog [Ctenodactylus gundi]